MTESELRSKTWFYRFPLPDGSVTPSYYEGALEAVHTTRVDMMARALREHFGAAPISSAVDLASHQGWFSWQLTQHGAERVTGIEPRLEHVADARAVIDVMGLSARITFEQCDVHDTTPERFGVHPLVLCFGLIYHLENPIGALRRARALTAKGGLCLVETQVVPGMRGFVDWGSYRYVRPLKGSFGIIDEMDETHANEASITGICLAPDTEGLMWIMRQIGFTDVALVPPPDDGYEQHLYGKRVMVRGVAV